MEILGEALQSGKPAPKIASIRTPRPQLKDTEAAAVADIGMIPQKDSFERRGFGHANERNQDLHLQYRQEAEAGTWQPLGPQVQGDGTFHSVQERLDDTPMRVYRVVEIP